LDGDKAGFYLTNGAQPSPRTAVLLQSQGVKLPDWVAERTKKSSEIRNLTKLRRNQPKDAAPAEPPAEPTAESTEATAPVEEAPEA
jgi:hypothetical protein